MQPRCPYTSWKLFPQECNAGSSYTCTDPTETKGQSLLPQLLLRKQDTGVFSLPHCQALVANVAFTAERSRIAVFVKRGVWQNMTISLGNSAAKAGTVEVNKKDERWLTAGFVHWERNMCGLWPRQEGEK